MEECEVVKEYLESGRGDRMDETTMGACTVNQVTESIYCYVLYHIIQLVIRMYLTHAYTFLATKDNIRLSTMQ